MSSPNVLMWSDFVCEKRFSFGDKVAEFASFIVVMQHNSYENDGAYNMMSSALEAVQL